MKYSFREFLALDETTQASLGNPEIYEELNQKIKNTKIVELEKMLKSADWWGFMSDDGRVYKKWKSEEEKIKTLRNLIGDDAEILYKSYAKKAGVMEGFISEALKDSRPSEYERFLYAKMKKWNLNTLDDLEDGEAKKRFWDEMDSEWVGNSDVEINLPESMFPEMRQVKGRGTIDYGERKTGERSLTASTFSDGNLFPEASWTAPTNNRRGKY